VLKPFAPAHAPQLSGSNGALTVALCKIRGAMGALTVVSGVINLLALTGSFYMLQVYDRVLSSHSIPTLVALSVLAAGMFIFQGVLDVLRNQASGRLATLFDERVSNVVQRLVIQQPMKGLSRSEAQAPMRDVDTIRAFLAGGGPVAFLDMPWTPVYLAFVALLHPSLGIVCLAGMVLLILLTFVTQQLSRHAAVEMSHAEGRRRAVADANARNTEALIAMGFAGRAIARYEELNRQFLALQTRSNDQIAVLTGISKAFRLILQSGILGLGAYLTVRGEITAGAIIAASIASSRALAPVEQMIAHWRGFQSARFSYARLDQGLRLLPEATDRLDLPRPRSSLTVEAATVCIPGTQRIVLHNANFQLRSGQALAVIGPSAAGKSSLARALTGIWPLTRGAMRLDGAEFDHWPAAQLGNSIGYLPQDVTLFEGTIRDNICRFAENADGASIIAAASAADIHEMILRLPEGYETNVGADGSALSAGQRQRVGLARALYGDPFLVVLDEPNSNLDADGESALTSAIHSVRTRGGIVVVVAHRPSALAAVDLVAMVNGGQIIAFGPKDEILKQVLRSPVRSVG
jgi:ATP-binding cassette, subfamily C, bacterial